MRFVISLFSGESDGHRPAPFILRDQSTLLTSVLKSYQKIKFKERLSVTHRTCTPSAETLTSTLNTQDQRLINKGPEKQQQVRTTGTTGTKHNDSTCKFMGYEKNRNKVYRWL